MTSVDPLAPRVGDRVVILPHSDLFMQGIRRARVTKIGRKYVHVETTLVGGRVLARRVWPHEVSVTLMAAWIA